MNADPLPEPRVKVPGWAAVVSFPLTVIAGFFSLVGASCLAAAIAMLGILVHENRRDEVALPVGMLVAAFVSIVLVMTAAAALNRMISVRHWRKWRLRRKQCPWCLYPTQGLSIRRCPECGETWTVEELGDQ